MTSVAVLPILVSIVVTFLFLHTPRIIVDIYEFLNMEVTNLLWNNNNITCYSR